MSPGDSILRRNFVIALVVHLAIVAGLVAWEWLVPEGFTRKAAVVELIVPADRKGELPVGPGHGRGAYTPPAAPPSNPVRPPPGPDNSSGPAHSDAMAGDESPAPPAPVAPPPAATAPAPPRAAPGEIGIPSTKHAPPANKTAPASKTTAPAAKTVSTATKSGATAPKSKTATATKSGTTGTSTGPRAGFSADEIRRRFGGAPAAREGGTQYGDNTVAGGGTGRSSVIGSPNGADNGMIGGVGPGSPHWDYFVHVHDKLYQAWEQPGSVRERGLKAVVLIKVARDGSIVDARILESSGNRLLDNSTLDAVKRVRLLQPPPAPLVKGNAAEISIGFEMEG